MSRAGERNLSSIAHQLRRSMSHGHKVLVEGTNGKTFVGTVTRINRDDQKAISGPLSSNLTAVLDSGARLDVEAIKSVTEAV